MSKRAVCRCLLIILASTSVSGWTLTLESGQVIENGVAVNAEDSAFGKRQLEKNGVFVGGNALHVLIEGKVTSIPLYELQGKNKSDIREIVMDAVAAEFSGDVADATDAELDQMERHVNNLEQNAEIANATENLEQAIGTVAEAAAVEAAIQAGALVDVTSELARELASQGLPIDYDSQGNVIDPRQ